jgi:hypothetical protein
MTVAYVTHMMKERSKGVETAKCGAEVKTTKSTAPMTVWWQNVDCPACLEAMGMYRTKEGLAVTEIAHDLPSARGSKRVARLSSASAPCLALRRC